MPKLQRWFIYEIRLSNMHLTHNPQCTIQNRNVHISVLNDALRDMGRVDCGICEINLSHFLFYMDVITYPCGNGSYGLLPFIFITIYGIVCVRLAHFGLGDWNDIYIYITLLSSTNRKYKSFSLSYFFRGCVPEMFITSYSVTYCIYIPGKPGFCFYHYCPVYDWCK